MSSIQPTGKSLLELEARQAKADMQKTANEKERAAAKARYGGTAEQVLANLDKIKACTETGKECNVYTGGVDIARFYFSEWL